MSKTTIPTGGIADSAISTAKIADDAVTAAKAGFSSGKIGQVITAQPVTSSFSTSNTSYTDVTNLEASITPSATSSKVLVLAYLQLYNAGSNQGNTARLAILRGSTIVNTFQSSSYDQGGNGVQYANTTTMSFLDSPSSSSSVTYKIQIKLLYGSSASVQAGSTSGSDGDSTPTITLLEVLA